MIKEDPPMAITEPIRNKQHIRALTGYYLQRGQLRNHALIVLGIHTALRIGDLLRLRWEDVYDFGQHSVRPALRLTERKTGKTKVVALNQAAAKALALLAAERSPPPEAFLMENRLTARAISRVQAYRIIRAAAEILRLGRVSCHSLRKTFGYHAWKYGVSLAVIMAIFNHSSLAVTRRYLGITQDDQNRAYRKLALLA